MTDASEDISSPLGTKDYWDAFYRRDLEVFEETGDEGEIWFGKRIQSKMIQYISRNVADKTSLIMDIGCGNGRFLFELAQMHFERLVGLDYSACGVALAQAALRKAFPDSEDQVELLQADFLALTPAFVAAYAGRVAMLTDKGTLDAITLNPDLSDYIVENDVAQAAAEGSAAHMARVDALVALYKASVERLMCGPGDAPQRSFMITSCNWTREELLSWFGDWQLAAEIEQQNQFTFGGVKGQVVTTLVFSFS